MRFIIVAIDHGWQMLYFSGLVQFSEGRYSDDLKLAQPDPLPS